MLIKCPECEKEISDKSEVCIHCGYPLKKEMQKQSKNICIIDGNPKDLTEQLRNVSNKQQVLKGLVREYGMSLADASVLHQLIELNGCIPEEYNSCDIEKYRAQLRGSIQSNQPKCPTCNSTNIKRISGLSKAGSVAMWGVFAAGRTSKTWHCNNCKYEW